MGSVYSERSSVGWVGLSMPLIGYNKPSSTDGNGRFK